MAREMEEETGIKCSVVRNINTFLFKACRKKSCQPSETASRLPSLPVCPGDAANLVDMTALAYGEKFEGMYPSVGACDEFIRLFLFKRVMCHGRSGRVAKKTSLHNSSRSARMDRPQRDIAALEGRLMGLREENEKIQWLCEMSVVSDGPKPGIPAGLGEVMLA